MQPIRLTYYPTFQINKGWPQKMLFANLLKVTVIVLENKMISRWGTGMEEILTFNMAVKKKMVYSVAEIVSWSVKHILYCLFTMFASLQ